MFTMDMQTDSQRNSSDMRLDSQWNSMDMRSFSSCFPTDMRPDMQRNSADMRPESQRNLRGQSFQLQPMIPESAPWSQSMARGQRHTPDMFTMDMQTDSQRNS